MIRPHRGWAILTMAVLTVFASLGLARFGYTLLLPPMQTNLGMNNAGAGGLATANLIGYLAMSVLGGALASHYGARNVIAVGLAVTGGGMLLTSVASDVITVGLWRTVTGVGSGASNVPVMALLSAWFAPKRRGLAAGVAVSGSSLALIALGPTVPGLLTHFGPNGWRVCWAIFGGITIVLGLLSMMVLRNSPAEKHLQPVGGDVEAVAAPAGAPGLHWGRVYRSGRVWHLGLVYCAFGFAYIIYLTFFTKRLIEAGDYSPASAGRLFMIMGWCSLACGLVWGGISDRIGRRRALVLVFGMHTLSFGLFAFAPSPMGFTVSAILFGLSAWSIPAIMAAGCGDLLGTRLAAAGLGFITLFLGIGQAVGPTVAGALADATGSLTQPLMLAALVSLLGGMGAAVLPHDSGVHAVPRH